MSGPEWLPPVPPQSGAPPAQHAPPWHLPARDADALPGASWWSRVAAALLDGLIVFVVAVAVTVLVGAGGGGGTAARTAGGFVFLLVALLYAPLLLATNEGRTIGKQALSIRVVTDDARPPGWGTAILREVLLKGIFGVIGIVLVIDVLVPLFDRRNRALHDMAAHTRVVSDITGW
ncbi:MAG TPA: RDD family protein [Solirubrobacteraceae bacterium]|nr:RDD family protein [Solirubrobacteraceae bacterium]